jgi:glycosyltransferase involved in cell wall biosynthesis
MKLLFFIPSFNDQEGLTELVKTLLNSYQNSSVLVVDDGSNPPLVLDLDTFSMGSRVILSRFNFNLGLGMATSVALDYFLDGDFEYLIRLDADGQHPVNEIEGLLFPLVNGTADVVWGERINHMILHTPKQAMGGIIKIVTAWMGRKIFNSDVEDWFTGFFAINRIAAVSASSSYLERYCEVQLLCIFYNSFMRVKTHYIEQKERNFGETRILWMDGVLIFIRSILIMLLYALRMYPK